MSRDGGARRWTDERIEKLVGNLLRAGVLIAAAVVLVSGICYLWHAGGGAPEYHSFRGEPASLNSVFGVLASLRTLDCRAFIQFGILLLIATPIARVAAAALGFYLQGDRTYVAVSLAVLAILAFSLSGYLVR
ncbi:MAG: DUF1634 domain-containing protein [Rhodospirillales bacterium]